MLVGVDVVHASVWSLDFHRKPGPGRPADFSDLGVIGPVTELVDVCFGDTVHSLELGWDEAALRELDLLVIPAAGGDGASFTEAECRLLETYVREGGSVLILGDGEGRSATSGHHPFGITVNGLLPGTRGDSPDSHLLTYDFTVEANSTHPAAPGVGGVHLYRPKGVESSLVQLVPVVEYDGHTLLGTAQYGAGRIAVIGNAEMFALPFLGREDNARLLLSLLSWLYRGEAVQHIDQKVLHVVDEHRFTTRTLPQGENLKEEPGPHVVDARPYAHLLASLADGYLPDSREDQEAFLAEAELRFHEFPRVIRHALARFRRNSTDSGVLLIRGLPVDPDLQPTPAKPAEPLPRPTPMSELWLAGFAQALGEPIAYVQEKQGQLFQNVAPTRHNAEKLSSESSSFLLDFHTEAAFHPFMPDYVLLHCLRPDHERSAKTISASLRMAVSRLSLRERAILSEPMFQTGIDYSFGSANGQKGNGPVLRVLYGDPFDPYITVDPDLMVGLTPEADAALKRLHVALNEVKQWARLDTGDLLIIDNRRTVHGRSEFQARYDGLDRWLQRVCVVRDLVPSAAHRRLRRRVIETAFAV
ncbi:TauD/TfdA family dioxygenase [Streptosporangium sp. NPDC020145]|uniref:TauD/TfdA family dioxygenase n=1 Tax=Streptosporangium jomthongense TaxID=1193683 RepID=A0ABV8EV16_9ACTN